MSRCPNEIDHDLIKHRRLAAPSIGVQADEVERLDLATCPTCYTTIARPCADAKHVESGGWPICGVPPEGALLASRRDLVDCPLCLTLLEQARPNKLAPYSWCRQPSECIALGRCPKNPSCGD
jgi:hypothetical protein